MKQKKKGAASAANAGDGRSAAAGARTHRLGDHPMIRACYRQRAEYTPVWFMRQAGSYIPEHKAMMAEHGLVGLTKTPKLAARAAVLPVRALGVDAAVMFADIIFPLAALGIEFHYEAFGPVIENLVDNPGDLERLEAKTPRESVPFILEAVPLIQKDLDGEVPLIGFSGGPFTLAAYMIEGRPSRTFPKTKAFMHRHPNAWERLMNRLSRSIIDYLQAKAEAGIDIIKLFDSWIGVLAPADYAAHVLPHTNRIFSALKETGLPRIHFGLGTAGLLDQLARLDCEVIGIDWRISLDRAWKRIGREKAIQGNLDPALLLAPFDRAAENAQRILAEAEGLREHGEHGEHRGHIFSLGHRIERGTDVDTLARLVDWIHRETAAR